jgi:hypothetical protein
MLVVAAREYKLRGPKTSAPAQINANSHFPFGVLSMEFSLNFVFRNEYFEALEGGF